MGAALSGLTVVITRSVDQQSELAEKLHARGANVYSLPLSVTVPPLDGGLALRHGLAHIETVDWVVVTSPNGARAVIAELDDHRPVRGFAAIGPGTAAVLRKAGLTVDIVPERSVGEGLVDSFPDGAGARVLLAQAESARRVVGDGLRAKGYDVAEVVAYRSTDATVDQIQRDQVADADVVLFTASSGVERFIRLVGVDALPPAVGVIGPITAQTAHSAGVSIAFVASEHTIDGLIEALVRWAEGSRVGE